MHRIERQDDSEHARNGHSDPLLTPLFQAETLASLGLLAAGIAHELGNPLSIISSSLQYLHQRLAKENDSTADFALTALEQVERMRVLLKGMLDFTRVRRQSYQELDLSEVVGEVVRFVSPECTRRGITFDFTSDKSLPKVWGNPFGIKQVLLNLARNALDALAHSGNEVRIGISPRSSGRGALVSVENNGPRIPDDILPDLFKPFHTTKDGGTGLGLYLSRQIAREQGGDLTAENTEWGVRFSLRLPYKEGEEKSDVADIDS